MTNKHFFSIQHFISILFFCLILLQGSTSAQPNLEWVKTSAGKSDNSGNAVAVDKDGNVYVAGSISGNVDFDPGPGVNPFIAPTPNCMFVSKYDVAGNLIWVKSIKAKEVKSIYVDDSCNVYTTGSFYGTVDFDPDSGVHTQTISGIVSIYICKWDSSGAYVWANKVVNGLSGGSYGSDNVSSLIVDNSGNAYLSGTISQCIFIAKFGNSGTLNFLYQFGTANGGSSSFQKYPLSFDNAGNLVMAGKFSSNIIDINPTGGTYNLDPVNGRFFILKLTPAGFFKWGKNFGSTSTNNNSNNSFAVSTDSSNNIYLTGCFTDTADFDPGATIYNLIGPTFKSPFLASYDSSGNFIWAKALHSSIVNTSLTLDHQDNILLTGTFTGTADFDPDSGVFNLTSSPNEVVFISKYSNTGILKWAKKSGGIKSYDIVSNKSSKVFIAGCFVSIADFDPSAAIYNLETPETSNSLFISKLDSSGGLMWVKGTQGNDIIFGEPVVDADGNLFTTGSFEGNVDFNPDSTTLYLNNTGNKDVYVRKLNSSGNLEWAISFGGSFTDEGLVAKTDNFGNVYICGKIQDTVDFDPGTGIYKLGIPANQIRSSYIAKYDPFGNFIWAKLFNENKFSGNSNFIADMDIDVLGNIFLTGKFNDTVDFDIGPGVQYLTTGSSSNQDVYIMKLNHTGNLVWAHQFGIVDESEYGQSVTVDGYGNSYFSGQFGYSTIDFDPGPGVFNMTSQMESTYVLKLNPAGNFIWAKQIGAYPGPEFSWVLDTELKASINGDLIITGEFAGEGLIDFDPNSGIDTSAATYLNTLDVFIMKWTESGNFVWKNIYPAPGSYFHANAISLTELNSGIIVETIFIEHDLPYIKVIQINNSGNPISNIRYVGENFNGYVGSDQHDNIYITGGITTTTDFDLSSGTYNITPSTSSDIFMSKYSTNSPACSIGPSAIISNAVNNTVCEGQPVALTQFGGVLSSGGNFEWHVDSCSGAIAATGNSVTFYPNDTTTYFVRSVDSCGVTTCNSITINVITSPLPPIVSGNGLFCTGDSIALDAGPGYQTYLWSTGSQTQIAYATGSGNYIVTISNGNGCTQSTSILVTTHPNPPVAITPATKVFICLGDTVPFSVTNDPGYTYQWLRNSSPLAGEINSYFDAFSTGFYSCLVTDANSCDSITPAVRVKIICMPPMDDQSKIGIGNSENPPTDFFVFYDLSNTSVHIQALSLKGNNYHLQLTDIAGKIIYKSDGKTNNSDLEKTIDCAAFTKGLYIITLRTEKEILTRKFIKE